MIGEVIANGAPQECAAAGMALCLGGLPYMLFKIGYCEKALKNQRKIISLLESGKPKE